ncbi:hypothetical protein [Viridibacterium curvum]|uniref:Lipoprotein n=1 Tax=Viridibacterium curvum TaxID=1101404 RepID=A0ABP9QMT4_9RHOO
MKTLITLLRGSLCGAIALLAAGCAQTSGPASETLAPPKPRPTGYALRLAEEDKLIFRGVANYDNAGLNRHGVLYGPGPIGFAAGLLVHGLIVNSTRESEKDKIQVAADQILIPYRKTLDGMRYAELMQRALATQPAAIPVRVIPHAAESTAEWTIESTPVFSMTQDQKALLLDNYIIVKQAGAKAEEGYAKLIRVVHEGLPKDPQETWLADNGAMLAARTTQLMVESLDIALRDLTGQLKNRGASKTYRYMEGGSEKLERAQFVRQDCRSVLVETLRGALMSIPQAPTGELAATCASSAPAPNAGSDAPRPPAS